ncbi:zinc ribbon domain-containing protein [Stenomitos frigidus ULC18]|uniref:Zinc ribbon domain-containing protein n=2 Tax=Stenomitos TaxID=1844270 RepID=A0A2T1EBL2_9CYAN|nr:zinc ribbon domain-containing protein [Stenomitos frigidus ULC18]
MPDCPRCHQPVEPQAIACPHCRTPLKAHGHPGIPLYQATGEAPLCMTCTYHADDTCTFPKRPLAMDCTLYNDITKPAATVQAGYKSGFQLQSWVKRNAGLLALLGLVLISLLVALLR